MSLCVVLSGYFYQFYILPKHIELWRQENQRAFDRQRVLFAYLVRVTWLAVGILPAHAWLSGHSGAGRWRRRLIRPSVVGALQVQDHLRWIRNKKSNIWKCLFLHSTEAKQEGEWRWKSGPTCSLAGGSLWGSEVRAFRSSEMAWRWVTSPNIEISSSWENKQQWERKDT